MDNLYGYVSCRASEAKREEQLAAIRSFGVPEEHLVCEEAERGKKRPAFQRLLRQLQPGDLLVVSSLEGLGGTTAEMFDNWSSLLRKRKAQLVVLDLPMLSRYDPADVTRPYLSEMVMELFSYFYKYERRNAHDWQAQKIEEAKARGVQFGRKRLEVDENYFHQVVNDWQAGKINSDEAARRLGLSRNSFFRRLKDAEITDRKFEGIHKGSVERYPFESFDPEVVERWKSGEISGRQAAQLLNISYSTFHTKTKKAGLTVEKSTRSSGGHNQTK